MRIRVGKNNVAVGMFSNYVINTLGIPVPGLEREVLCRMQETDPEVFSQIFIRNEYKQGFLPPEAKYIIDAGANVGYSVLFFHRAYPDATIIALEQALARAGKGVRFIPLPGRTHNDIPDLPALLIDEIRRGGV